MDPDFFRQEWFYFSRISIAQIQAVDTRFGTIDIVLLDGFHSPKLNLSIPWPGMSISGTRSKDNKLQHFYSSSWIRYMPQVGDFVYVGFSTTGKARALGMALPQDAYEDVVNIKSTDSSKFPGGDFKELQPGEWDMRSSGGAYVFGGQFGQLLLSAGPQVQLDLNKTQAEGRGRAPFWRFESFNSTLRLGEVRRTLAANPLAETDVSLLDATATNEFALRVANSIAPASLVSTPLVDLKMGGVRDALGVPELATTSGLPIRYKRRVHAPTSTSVVEVPVFTETVDASGNEERIFIPTALSITTVALGATNTESYAAMSTTASAGITIAAGANLTQSAGGVLSLTAPVITLTGTTQATVDASQILVGGETALANPAVHGTALKTALNALLPALTALSAALGSAPTLPPSVGVATGALATVIEAVTTIINNPTGEPTALLSTKTFIH